MDLGFWAECLCQCVRSFAVDEDPHVLANAILFVDEPEPDAGMGLVERVQHFVDRFSCNPNAGPPACIGPQLLRYEDRHAQSRGTASIE